MKKTSILIISLFGVFTWAQRVEGIVKDQNQQSISYAEIVLSQNKKKSTTLTDDKGSFNLTLPENGSYLLEVFNGSEKIFSDQIDVQGSITKTIIANNTLVTEKQVESVNLVAQKKKLVERKVDRLVFNIENSVASQGLDAVEALAKTPMIRATDDAISIAGKSNVAVMVNDRLLTLSGQELINYLKSLRSDDIAKIEVITTPPSKYAAEGKSGLINIILKKNTALGWNGSLQMSGNYSKVASWRDGATLNYQGTKLSMTANAGIGENIWIQKNHNYSMGPESYWKTDSDYWGKYKYKNANIKAEYKINDNNNIGFSYNLSHSTPENINSGTTRILNQNQSTEFFSKSTNLYRNNNHYATGFYDIKLDSLKSKLSLSANLMSYKGTTDNYVDTFSNNLIQSLNKADNHYQIFSAQADLEKNFEKIKTEAGLKFSSIKNDSYTNFFDINDNVSIINHKKSSDFIYHEKNYAAYISTNFKISEKWDTKLGLRYEYTELNGISPKENLYNESQYGKFFPTAYLSYKPNDNNVFSINYSRRIRRPYFGNLNPAKVYSSEIEYYSGNPYLKPSFTDNIELSYVLKNNFTTTLYYSHSNNSWDRVQKWQETDNIKYSTTENFFNENQAGLTLNYNYNKLKWLESNMYLTTYYSQSNTKRQDVAIYPGSFGANMNWDNSFFLTNDKNVVFMLGYWGDMPSKKGHSQIDFNNSVYTGLKLNFLDKKLAISAYLNDVFNSQAYKGKERYPDFTSSFKYKGISQNMYVSVTYKFGNNNVKGATKQNKFEEQNRAGGNTN